MIQILSGANCRIKLIFVVLVVPLVTTLCISVGPSSLIINESIIKHLQNDGMYDGDDSVCPSRDILKSFSSRNTKYSQTTKAYLEFQHYLVFPKHD